MNEPNSPDSKLPFAEFQLRKLILPVYLPHLFISFAISLTLPTLPLLGKELVNSDLLIGILVSARYFGVAFGDLPASLLISHIGLKRTTYISLFFIIVSPLLFILFDSYLVALLARTLEGIGLALWLVARQTQFAFEVPNSMHGRAGAMFGGTFRIGILAGPLVGGLLAAAATGGIFAGTLDQPLIAPYYLQLIIAVIAFVIVLLTNKSAGYPRSTWRGITVAFKETFTKNKSTFLVIGAIALTIQSLRSAREILIPLQGDSLGLDVAVIGQILSLSALFDVLLFPVSGTVMDKFGRKFTTIPAFLVISLAIGMLAIAVNPWLLLIAAIFIGLGNGLSSGIVITLGADLAPRKHPSEFVGVWRVIADSGSAAGPFMAGAISSSINLVASSLSIMGIGLAGLIILIFWVPETLDKKRKKKH